MGDGRERRSGDERPLIVSQDGVPVGQVGGVPGTGLDEFQAWTVRTSVYPGVGSGSPEAIAYATLGLVGELGEYQEVESENLAELSFVSLEGKPQTQNAGARARLVREAGDAFFYAARLCAELRLSLEHLWLGREDACHVPATLLVHLGRVVEAVKKHVRGDYDRAECALRIQGVFGRLLRHLGASLDYHKVTLEEVLRENRRKLEARLAEGKIRGSGSER